MAKIGQRARAGGRARFESDGASDEEKMKQHSAGKKEINFMKECSLLPREASYVFMYSDVMNCDTSAVLPTPEAPGAKIKIKLNNIFEMQSSSTV